MTFPFRLSGPGLRRLAGLGLLLLAAAPLRAEPPSQEKVAQAAQQRYGARVQPLINRWFQVMQDAGPHSDQDKIRRVNEFFNRRVQFVDDSEAWGRSDYWATPLETLGRGLGDCEDFSIAKYFTLRFLDVPNSKLRLTYVKAKIGGMHSDISQAHMVLAYYETPDAEPQILDNLITEVRPASRRPDLAPVFSFNSEGLWVGSGPTAKAAGSSTARLSRWRDVMARMQAEGFE
jgi:predicted transglutaminase-like cysteine proteinase